MVIPLILFSTKLIIDLKKLFVKRTNVAIDLMDANINLERKIMVLPYVQPLSEFISSNIDKSKAIVGFCCLNKLSRFIKVHKDVDHASFKNNVIYKISCNDCDATYVGQTKAIED